MFYTPPSLFDPPTYPRKKLPLAGSPPEQAQSQPQPEPTARVPYRPTEQASPRPPGNTIPLIFRALAHPSQRRPLAAASASSDSFPALQSQTQPASAPAPSQPPALPQQTPPPASPATQTTEEAPKFAAAFQENAAHVEAESTLRDQSPTATAAPGQQLSTKPTVSTPQSPSQPPSTPASTHSPAQPPQPPQTPSTPSPAPQSTEEAPKVAADFKEAAAPQSPNTPALPAPQSPSQSPTPPAPPQPPAPPPQAPPAAPTATADSEDEPKVVEALKQAAAEVEADTARQKRDAQLAELEANGMAEHAKALRALDAEMAQRRANIEKKHPQHDAQYEASMRELEKEKEARQAPVMEKIQAFKTKERADNLRAAKIVASRESKLPATRGKTEEQKQAEWKAQMERVGLDPNNHDHVSAYWDAKRLHYLNDGRYAKYDWDGSTPKREGFGSAVLSDGSLHVAPEFIHNDKKYAAVVAASGASEAEKARAMADLPRLQQAYAQAMLPILKQAGSTRAAQWIPGIASFQKWQSEKPRQGTEAEQANEYLKEMNQRGVWSKGTDNVLRSLLAGFADMGTMGAGMAGMVGVPGASETAAEWSKRSSDFMAPISAEGGNSGTASAIFGHVARMAGPMVATLLITRGLGGGIKTMSALSGAQTAGSQYAETYGRLREEGKTHGQAWLATAPFALASGLATAFLTAAGGATGFEAALSTKAGTQSAKDAAQGFWKKLLTNVPKHALADIPQELPDKLFSQMMSALATNHDADLGKVVGDFIKNSPQLIGAIALMGGAGGAVQTQQQFKNSGEQTQMEESGDSKARDETKPPPAAEPSIPDTTTPSRIPSFDEALAASQTIEKLKAQKTPLSLEQQQELDAAEKTFAKKTEANILAQKATLEARGEKIHPTTAAALAKAQATLARPAPRDRGPLPTVPDARKTIQDLSGKAAAGTLKADEAHQMAHAQRAIAQQRVNDLKALGTAITPQQQRQLNRFEEILNASPYGTELPKVPPPGYDPHATNPAHREWHPPHGDKPAHPPDDRFTPDALALSKNEIKTTTESLKEKGHSHDRHGPEVTEGQLSDRAMHGIDPITQTREDGERSRNDHNYSRHATQFTSERAMTQAVKSVENSAEYTDELNKAEKEGKDRFTVKNVSLESALGPNYQEHVRGRTRTGSAANPSGSRPTNLTDGNFIAQYKRDPATGKFYLNTIFANPSLTHEPN